MKIAFLHPDLGIGGAERLIVDAALALKSRGHEIRIYTNHHDPKHCFTETKDGSLDTVVVGDWLPRSTFGRFIALWAYIRIVYAAVYLLFCKDFQPDVYLCDQVSVCIPVLKLTGMKVVFYCHFPDKLLTDRKHWLKRIYRWPLDWLEEKTTGRADVVLVNSKFTAQVVRQTFPSLNEVDLQVVYPSIKIPAVRALPDVELGVKTNASTIFLSINRYERKKNIKLAIEAMDHLRKTLPTKDFNKIHLIIAGGYDQRVVENVEHYEELKSLVEDLFLDKSISFLRSPSDDQKQVLIHSCTAVLYTPSFEHFGIVPLEAGLGGRPVIAHASGGPLETVLDHQTGFLCDGGVVEFAERMAMLARDRSMARELGTEAARHVQRNFSFKAFAQKLDEAVQGTGMDSSSR